MVVTASWHPAVWLWGTHALPGDPSDLEIVATVLAVLFALGKGVGQLI